jgi:hypothetical protein
MSVDKYSAGKQKAIQYAKMLENKLKEYNAKKEEVQFFIDIEFSKNDKSCLIGMDFMEGDIVYVYFMDNPDLGGYANPSEEEINKLAETAKSIIE